LISKTVNILLLGAVFMPLLALFGLSMELDLPKGESLSFLQMLTGAKLVNSLKLALLVALISSFFALCIAYSFTI